MARPSFRSGRPTARAAKLIAGFLALMMIAAACGDDDGDDGEAAGEIKTGVGVEGDVITIGQISDLSGIFQAFGKPLSDGQETYWQWVNGNGGIDAGDDRSFTVEVITKDHAYNPQTAQTEYAGIKDQILLLGQLLGTPITNALEPVLEEDGVLASPGSLASPLALNSQLAMIGTPYRMEAANAIDYHLNEVADGDFTVASVYIDSDYGMDGKAGVDDAIETYDEVSLADGGDIPFPATQDEFTDVIDKIIGSGADAVMLTTSPSQTAKIVGGAAAKGFQGAFYGNSPTFAVQLLATEAAPALQALLKTSTSSAFWGEDVPGMTDMMEAIKEYKPEYETTPDNGFIFGWTQAALVHAIIEKGIENGDITREGILKAFGELEDVDLGGLQPSLSYGDTPESRIPSRETRVSEIVPVEEEPGGVKPLTDYFESKAAKDAKVESESSEEE